MLNDLRSWIVLLDETLPDVPFIDYGLYIKNYRPKFLSFSKAGNKSGNNYILSSPLVYIETTVNDPDPDWKTGGWMQQTSQILDWIPDENQRLFSLGRSQRFGINRSSGFNLIDLGSDTYNLQLTFPYWLRQLHIRTLVYIPWTQKSG